MVQSWYMGGTSFWDFTDSDNPREIGYFERGPNGGAGGGGGGTWSSYYYNGHVFSHRPRQGLRRPPRSPTRACEGRDVTMDQLNVQSQPVYAVK